MMLTPKPIHDEGMTYSLIVTDEIIKVNKNDLNIYLSVL
jgi:hypothetical protein